MKNNASLARANKNIRRRKLCGKAVTVFLLLALSVVFLVPFAWMLLTSLKSMEEVYQRTIFPTKLHFDNYILAVTQIPFLRYAWNTIVITALTAIAFFQQITGIYFTLFDVMSIKDEVTGISPLDSGLLVCGQIGIVLIGAFPMVKWITRHFGGVLNKVGAALGMNETGSAGLVATLANNIAMFNIMGEMNPKGKILNVAFAVSAAFVFGDHLGFTAGVEQQMVFPVILGKLVAGITALILANVLAPKLLSKIESADK